MRISYAGAALAVMMSVGAAGAASAQPYYGYGQLPPAPYEEAGGYGGGYGGGGCGAGSFTLLGARAGVTVLGFDLGANAHFSAPTGEACGGGGGYAPSYPPAPEAPPPAPMGYGPPPAYGYGAPAYGPMQPPIQGGWGYAPPCGCEPRGW